MKKQIEKRLKSAMLGIVATMFGIVYCSQQYVSLKEFANEVREIAPDVTYNMLIKSENYAVVCIILLGILLYFSISFFVSFSDYNTYHIKDK